MCGRIFHIHSLVWGSLIFMVEKWFKNLQMKVQFSSVIQSCPTLCDPMNRSTPGLPVHHQMKRCLEKENRLKDKVLSSRDTFQIQCSHSKSLAFISFLCLLPPSSGSQNVSCLQETDTKEIIKQVWISFYSISCSVLLLLFSCVRLFATPWTAASQASLSFTISQNLLRCMSIELVMPSNHLILCRPLQSLSSPSAFSLSQQQGLFQWVSSSHQGGQSIGASASVLPVSIQDWFPLGLIGLISLQSKRLLRVFSFYLVSCFIPSFHSVCYFRFLKHSGFL